MLARLFFFLLNRLPRSFLYLSFFFQQLDHGGNFEDETFIHHCFVVVVVWFVRTRHSPTRTNERTRQARSSQCVLLLLLVMCNSLVLYRRFFFFYPFAKMDRFDLILRAFKWSRKVGTGGRPAPRITCREPRTDIIHISVIKKNKIHIRWPGQDLFSKRNFFFTC